MLRLDEENVAHLSAPACALLTDRFEGQVGRLRRYIHAGDA